MATPETEDYRKPDEKGYVFESIADAQKSGMWAKTFAADKKDSKETFGWDVFNEDSLYRAYTKRTAKIEREMKDKPDAYNEMTEEQKR